MLLASAVALLQLAAVTPPSPSAVWREARRAQVRFETTRRANLPWDGSTAAVSRSQCDVVIGRFCYWYDSTESEIVPEPRQITEARRRLLAVLDTAANLSVEEGRAWVVGQRVRYLVEAGRPDAALIAARGCSGDAWWCAALGGLALHVSARYSEADSAFAVALSAMPERQRCEWHDLRRLLDATSAKRFAATGCHERVSLANHLWALSRPLWSVAGNDLRTEHFARHTMALILAGAANPHGVSWGEDSRELMLRYGWAEWFTRRREDFAGLATGPHVTGHDREPSYHFFPSAWTESSRLDEAGWRLRDPLAPSRYAPRHLERLNELPHQLVRFPRGDSTDLFVRYEIVDSALRADTVVSFLCTPRHCSRDRTPGTIAASIGAVASVVSIEVRGDSSKRAARARYEVDPLPCVAGRCLSDLLLFDGTTVTDSDGREAIRNRALTTLRLSNRIPLGVYWELQADTVAVGSGAVAVGLTVSPVAVSLRRRVAARLHLAPPVAPVSLRWQSPLGAGIQSRHVILRLPENARGRYRVTLTIDSPDSPPLVAIREIDLR